MKLIFNPMKFLWWLQIPLFWWVKTKIAPTNIEELGIDPEKPICYVIRSWSLVDALIIDHCCKEAKLRGPHNNPAFLKFPKSASMVWLAKQGFLWSGRGKKIPRPISRLVKQAANDAEMDVQIVPVSVYYGRNPGKEEKSLFKLLFFDDERAGFLQKLLITIAQGRNTLVNFGKPISLRSEVDSGKDEEQTAKKLRRVLRVHFKRQRIVTMGPLLSQRSRVMTNILRSPRIGRAIVEESQKKKITMMRAEKRARKYINEIAADKNPSILKFADIILNWIWNKIFDGVEVKNIERVREIAEGNEIVYLPCHRSHMDYLLVGHVLYGHGFEVPHVAAGINMNFWPFGYFVRKSGGFFLRRRFAGNRLYSVVFTEYVSYLLTRGHAMEFFPEGTRSRTGRMLPAKTGMLSMIVQSYFRNSSKPIVFVPIYCGYEKVMEVRTYIKELRGDKKRKESFFELVKARRALKLNLGKAYVSFGEPVFLGEALDSHRPSWKDENINIEIRPPWLSGFVNDLAEDIIRRTNAVAAITPSSLFSLTLLSTPQKAMTEKELLLIMAKFQRLLSSCASCSDAGFSKETAKEQLEIVEKLGSLQRFEHPGGDVIFLREPQSTLMNYARNNILHFMAVPSLVASFFAHNDTVSEAELVEGCEMLYPFLEKEFFLHDEERSVKDIVLEVIEIFVNEGLIVSVENGFSRPDVVSSEFVGLKVLGRTLGQTLERYSVVAALLAKVADESTVEREEFEIQCRLMAQRISILSGGDDPEFFDARLYHDFVDSLKRLGYVTELEEQRLKVESKLKLLSEKSLALLSSDIRHSIQRVELIEGKGK